MIDGGGQQEIRAPARADGAVRRRVQRDRQPVRPRPLLAARGRDRAPRGAASSRSCSSPAATATGSRSRPTWSARRCTGSRTSRCLTGDDVTAGDEPEARRVFDLDSVQLVSLARSLGSAAHYLSGRPISPAPHFFIGAVENPGAPPLDYRVQPRRQEGAGRRRLPAAAALLPHRSCSSTSCARRTRPDSRERIAMHPVDLHPAHGRRDAVRRLKRAGHRRPAGDARSRRASHRRRARVLRDRLRARLATRSRSRASPDCTSSRSARTPASRSCAGGSESQLASKGKPMDTVLGRAPLA